MRLVAGLLVEQAGELQVQLCAGNSQTVGAVEGDVAGAVRLIGASGIVKRLIELAHTIDAKPDATARAPFPAERTLWLGANVSDSMPAMNQAIDASANGDAR